jgi:IS30 family transposase
MAKLNGKNADELAVKITDKDIQYVQHKLNNRPRKKLGFLTPIEFLSLKLSEQKLAFIT